MQPEYGDAALSCSCVFEWRKLLLSGRETAEDDARYDRPSTMHTAEITELVQELLQHNRKLQSECFQMS